MVQFNGLSAGLWGGNMLRRIYVHNFKSFINFEVRLGDFHLLAGPNGGGKSALFDVIGRIKALICGGARVQSVFPPENRTLGIAGAEGSLKVELDVEDREKNMFSYQLEVAYDEYHGQQRISVETLTFNQTPLFESRLGEAQLYRDNGSQGPNFPMDWRQSGVGFLMASKDNKKMTWFKNRLFRVWILRIIPDLIGEESRKEARSPDSHLADFADWYRYLAQAHPDIVYEVSEALRTRISGFRALRLRDVGEGKILYASFESDLGTKPVDIGFKQLSEGQKALIGLYTTFYGLFAETDATLCVDEPENFLALPEIQPWLDGIYEACEEEGKQGLVISHHPRVLNFLAADAGIWLERENGVGPTRTFDIRVDAKGPISIDQLVERGWIDGGEG
jgi:predicted ATPase